MSLVVAGSGDCLMPPSPDGPSDHGDQIGHISPCQVPQQFANLGHGQWDAWYLYRFHSRIALGSVLGRDIAILAERIDDDARS